MRPRRLILALALTAAAALGLWRNGRIPSVNYNDVQALDLAPLAARTPPSWPARLRLVRAWHLTSGNNRFGGYSALLAGNDGTLTAVSDVGWSLRFRRPNLSGPPDPRFDEIMPHARHEGERYENDIESATQDLRTGLRWYGYEGSNRIQRVAPGDGSRASVQPADMRGWSENGGPEAMVRLADGRFIVLEEDPPWLSTGARAGLLFPGDPLTGVKPSNFTFRPPIGYSPSDAAALPDGRVVILLRVVDPPFPPFFKGMLIVADPADIARGKEWRWQKLADLEAPLPTDNYEGLAIVPDTGGVTLWLISDDNFAHFQRTLLLELRWQMPPPRGGASGR